MHQNTDLCSLYTKINGINKLGSLTHVKSITMGYKTINNQITDIRALVFNVRQKKDLKDLTPDQVIPKTVVINGIEYPTDVMSHPSRYTILTNGCFGNNIAQWSADHKKRFRQYISNNDQGNPTPPSGTLNQPVMGGISFGQQKGGTGTLGCVVKDISEESNNKICGLSNLHVLVEDGFYAHEKKILSQLGYPNKITNILKKGTVQPGEPVAGFSPPVYTKEKGVGFVKRYVPLYLWNWDENNQLVYHNYVDAAISSLQLSTEDTTKDPSSPPQTSGKNYVVWTNSTKQFNMTFTDGSDQSSYPFATTEEIESMEPGTRVWKSGRTTGFVGKDECVLEFKGKVPFVNVYGYTFSIFPVEVLFEDVLQFGYRRLPGQTVSPPAAILGGDSGSVLIADFGGTKKIVGLNFAGGAESRNAGPGSAGFACRIDHVSKELFVDSFSTDGIFWDENTSAGENELEELKKYFDDPTKWKFITEDGLSEKKKLISDTDNQTYYQCGLYKKR